MTEDTPPDAASDMGEGTPESTADDALIEQVMAALRVVIDPELGYNIVDLGLVYDVAIDEGTIVRIWMTTTTRGCPATDYLKNGARDAAWGVPGVGLVDVMLTYDPPWSPRMMSPEAQEFLGISAGGGW